MLPNYLVAIDPLDPSGGNRNALNQLSYAPKFFYRKNCLFCPLFHFGSAKIRSGIIQQNFFCKKWTDTFNFFRQLNRQTVHSTILFAHSSRKGVETRI